MKKAKTKNENEQTQENNTLLKRENVKHFILIYESVYKNNNLTSDEIALIVKLSAAAPTFKPTKQKLMSLLHISEYALIKASKGLQEKGYLTILNGGKSGSLWILKQEPLFEKNKDKTNEDLINDLLIGEITIPELLNMLKANKITKADYNYITSRLFEIAKKPWLD